MEGRTVVVFRCPCSDVEAPPGVSFCVEIVGPPGFPSLLYGSCSRCRDKWLAEHQVRRLLPGGCSRTRCGFYQVRRLLPDCTRGAVVFPELQATWELEDLTEEEIEEITVTQQALGGTE